MIVFTQRPNHSHFERDFFEGFLATALTIGPVIFFDALKIGQANPPPPGERGQAGDPLPNDTPSRGLTSAAKDIVFRIGQLVGKISTTQKWGLSS